MKISINNLITIGWREDYPDLRPSEYADVAAHIAERVQLLALKQFTDDPRSAWMTGMLYSVAQSIKTGGPLPSERALEGMLKDANRHHGVIVWPTPRGLLEADTLTRSIDLWDPLAWCFVRQPELMERDYTRLKIRYNRVHGRKH